MAHRVGAGAANRRNASLGLPSHFERYQTEAYEKLAYRISEGKAKLERWYQSIPTRVQAWLRTNGRHCSKAKL